MKIPKIFIACDTTNLNKIKKILKDTQKSKIKFGYKFGLELLNSKYGRKFVANLKRKITFGDYKLGDIPNTCESAIKAVKDLNFNYISQLEQKIENLIGRKVSFYLSSSLPTNQFHIKLYSSD